MQIRLERPDDATTIYALTDTAFKGMPFSDDTEGVGLAACGRCQGSASNGRLDPM
jgi:hypothetical protein